MRKTIWIILGIFALIIAAAIIIPLFVSLNDLRAPIAEAASKAIGRPVFIKGDISLSLLPSPTVKIDDVSIANLPEAKAPHFLWAKSLRGKVAFWPLLKFQIKIESIDIDNPEIFLEKLSPDKNNWTFVLAQTDNKNTSQFEIAIDKVSIISGQAHYSDESNSYNIENINLDLALKSLQGPFSGEGSLEAFGQNLKFIAQIAQIIDPVSASLTLNLANKIMIKTDFQWLKANNEISGLLDLSGNLEIIKALKPDIELPAFLKNNIKLGSSFKLVGSNLALENLGIELAEAKAHGHISVNWEHALKLQGNLGGIPGNGTFDWTLQKQGVRYNGNLKANISNLKTLLAWLEVDSKKIPAGIAKNVILATNYSIGEQIHLSNIDLKIADAKLSGDLSFQKKANINNLWVDLTTPHLEKLLKIFDKKADKALGAAKISGSLKGNPKKLDFDVLMNLGVSEAKAKGTALGLDDKLTFNINLDAKSSNLNTTLESLGMLIPHRIGATMLTAHISGNPKHFKLGQLNTSFSPNLIIKGDVDIDQSAQKPKIIAHLATNTLDLQTLMSQTSKNKSHAPEGQWSREPINLTFLNKLDAQVSLSAPKIVKEDIIVMNPKITASLNNGVLDISPLLGSIFGGDFRIIGQLTSENKFKINANLKDANIPNLASRDTKFKIIKGKLSFNSELAAQGKSMFDVISSLKGTVTFVSKDGVINGIDLPALSDHLSRLQDANSVLSLVQTALARGKTPYSTYNGNIVLSGGVATINNMTLATSVANASISGLIDLPRYTLKVALELSLSNHPTWPPIGLRLSGPINNPARQPDVTRLASYLIQNVFKNIIEKNIKIPKTTEDIFNIFTR